MKILVSFFVLFMYVSQSPLLAVNGNMGAHDGYTPDGSEAAPWLIEDLADFDVFADPANAETYWSEGVFTRLECDLDLYGRKYERAVIAPEITPVHNHTNYSYMKGYMAVFEDDVYDGIFDGNFHKITNLDIDTNGVCNDYLGLFGYVGTNGEIKQLRLTRFGINKKKYKIYNGAIGGLAGFNSGKIFRCMTEGFVSGFDDTGGLCGGNTGEITECCSVSTVEGELYVGGLVGYNNGKIENCYAVSNVTGYVYYATLVGASDLDGYIRHCYCVANRNYVEKICDYNFGVIIGCYIGSYELETYIGWNDGCWKEHWPFSYFDNDDENIFYEFYEYPILSWQVDGGDLITTDYPQRRYSGSGTEADPFVIFNSNDMENLTLREPDWDKYFVLGDDIWMHDWSMDDSFNPIADFSGKFDGRGFTIYDLELGYENPNKSGVGLFGRVSGTVENIVFDDVFISGVSESGSICSSLYGGTIRNCHVTGHANDVNRFGGICFLSFNGTIEDCSFEGEIEGEFFLAGICFVLTDSNVKRCSALADITGDSHFAGFACGVYNTHISQCYASSQLYWRIVYDEYPDLIAGFAGGIGSGSVVDNCYSTGAIINITDDRDCYGAAFAYDVGNSTVTNCFTDVSAHYPGFGDTSDDYYYSSEINNCFWNGDNIIEDNTEYYYGEMIDSAQMAARATFTAAGWDFMYNKSDGAEDIWYMSDTGPRFSRDKCEIIDMEEFALLAASWLCEDFTEADNSSYADFVPDGKIDLADLVFIAEKWLFPPNYTPVDDEGW